jgi:hypothetical protein
MGSTIELKAGEFGRIIGRPESVYSKPIIVLNDSRSASGGDFMPAILQSNNRALIVGETSLGLGGPVYRSQKSMPATEMFVRCTMGYCQRADGLPIENLGVVPDVQRWVSREDLLDGFTGYANDILNLASAWADGKTKEEVSEILLGLQGERLLDGAPLDQEKERNQIARLFAKFPSANESISRLTLSYAALFKKISKIMKKSKDFPTDDQWHSLVFPLPKVILDRDLFLSNQRYKDGAINRLQEMIQLPAYRAEPSTLKLLRVIEKGLKSIGDVRVSGCQFMLEPL